MGPGPILRGCLGAWRLIPSRPLPALLSLLPPQLVMLARRPLRLATALVCRRLPVPLATLAVRPLVHVRLLVRGLAGPLPILAVHATLGRLLRRVGILLLWVLRAALGPYARTWPPSPSPALTGPLRLLIPRILV